MERVLRKIRKLSPDFDYTCRRCDGALEKMPLVWGPQSTIPKPFAILQCERCKLRLFAWSAPVTPLMIWSSDFRDMFKDDFQKPAYRSFANMFNQRMRMHRHKHERRIRLYDSLGAPLLKKKKGKGKRRRNLEARREDAPGHSILIYLTHARAGTTR